MAKILIALLLVVTGTACVQAARPAEFNVDIFCGWDGCYRPMEWTPVEIGISSDLTEPFGGTLVLSGQQDGLNTLNIMHDFVLTPERGLSLPLVTKFAFGISKCTLRIRDERGRTRWKQGVDLWDFSTQNRMLRVVQAEDLLIGLLGQPRFGLLRVPNETVCSSQRGLGKVYVGAKSPNLTPWDWTGYASLDVLVMYDLDWNLLRPEQLQAISEWVSNGGTLIVVLGRHPLPQNTMLTERIPFRIEEPRQVEISAETLTRWGLDVSGPEPVTAWPLSAKSNATLLREVKGRGGDCVYGTAYAGFGRVAVMAFDPSQLSDQSAESSARFWVTHIAAVVEAWPSGEEPARSVGPDRRRFVAGRSRTITLAGEEAEDDANGSNPSRYRIGIAQSAVNQVMEHLYQLRQMRPLSIWWVILTLSGLAILLGPVDYLLLKRLDKLPYTWLTSTFWIFIFTVGAYYGVQTLRGGKMQLRVVSVVDGIAGSDCTWATYYTGLFAPRSDDYRLDGLESRQWWSAISPSREQVWVHQQEAGMRQVHCVQADGANLPVSLPINIWTIQSLLGEMPRRDTPFEVRVERRGEEARVEIANTSDAPIRGGFVLWQDFCASLGPVLAGATQTFEVTLRSFRSWEDGAEYVQRHADQSYRTRELWRGLDVPRYPRSQGPSVTDAFLAQGCLNRTVAMQAALCLGAALVTVEYGDAPPPFVVTNRSYDVRHIQYARQLVLPAETREGRTHD